MAITLDGTNGITVPQGASQAQAEAGVSNTVLMTPLRVAQAIASLGSGVNIQSFTASGTYTPTSGYSYAIAFVTGGGRGGSGASNGGASSGGIAGDTCISILSLSGLGAQTVTIGSGGVGVYSNAGTAGGDSSIGTLLVAKGGGSATSNVGTFQINASPAGGSSTYTAGMGGGSFWGSGAGPTSSTVGQAALAYGSGGGGSYTPSGTSIGGAGKAGVVFILEFK